MQGFGFYQQVLRTFCLGSSEVRQQESIWSSGVPGSSLSVLSGGRPVTRPVRKLRCSKNHVRVTNLLGKNGSGCWLDRRNGDGGGMDDVGIKSLGFIQ